MADTNETARFLRRYQQWRVGEIESFYPDSQSGPEPKEITAAINAAIASLEATPPADAALTCDKCGALTNNPWHGSEGDNRHVHYCDACYAALRAHPTDDSLPELTRLRGAMHDAQMEILALKRELRARSAVPIVFPRQPNGDGGWVIDANYVAAIRKDCFPAEWQPCEEEVEAVLLAVERERAMLAASKGENK